MYILIMEETDDEHSEFRLHGKHMSKIFWDRDVIVSSFGKLLSEA